jgi:hypothetical protein
MEATTISQRRRASSCMRRARTRACPCPAGVAWRGRLCVTETLHTVAGWTQMVSHSCGEIADTLVANLATRAGCGQLKTKAPARGERVAEYNRLIEIEASQHRCYGLA